MSRFIERNVGLMVSVIITLLTVSFVYGKLVQKVEEGDNAAIIQILMCMREDISSLKTDMSTVKKEQDTLKLDVKELLKK